jgi:hypothetical protein
MRHLTAIAHHRNGVMGRDGKESMLGIKFDSVTDYMGNERKDDIYTAVFNVEKLATGDIAFASNSYRGDKFDEDMTAWSNMYEAERSAAATKESEREARAQATMKAFAEGEAINARVNAGVEWLVQGKIEADKRMQ